VKVTFNFEKGSVTADLDPRMVADLHDLLSRQAVRQDDVLRLLQRIAFFDDNRDKIISSIENIPPNRNLAVVVHGDGYVFANSEDEAFVWASENIALGPVYIVNFGRDGQLVANR
jgi:hypothetical protein